MSSASKIKPKRASTDREKQQRSERAKQKRKEAKNSSPTVPKNRPTFSEDKPNVDAYKILCKQLLSIIDNIPQTNDLMGYNSVTWLTIIQRIATNITNDEGSDMKLDCWKTSFSRQSTGNLYQQMAVQPFTQDQPIRDRLERAKNCQRVDRDHSWSS